MQHELSASVDASRHLAPSVPGEIREILGSLSAKLSLKTAEYNHHNG
jgi:hypothetical protein